MTAGSDIGNGRANSLTDTLVFLAQAGEQRAPRRVGQRGEGAIEFGRCEGQPFG